MTEYRECNDPEVLAAAVADGVRVEYGDENVWFGAAAPRHADDFHFSIRRGYRYRVPAWWRPGVAHWVPSAVPAPDGAELARWDQVKVGEGYAGPSDQHPVTKTGSNPDMPGHELVWRFPATEPTEVTVTVPPGHRAVVVPDAVADKIERGEG